MRAEVGELAEAAAMIRALGYLPSPTQSVWQVGPLPVRAYALCIVAGILLALGIARRRWAVRGGRADELWDVAGWAIPFGIAGGRLYHVASDPELYFGHGRHPLNALKIWDGGLGIWGAVALGAVGAWIGCRRRGIRLVVFADTVAPGVVAAQGVGRWGNWFNNELYGGPTSLPWRLQIHRLDVSTGRAALDAAGHPLVVGYLQPTFLYESIWDLSAALLLLWIDARRRLGTGQLFALYVAIYTVGRGWIEALRHDHANHILGLRLNDWTSLLVFVAAVIAFRLRRGCRDDAPYPARREATVTADTAPR
ncbi:MAG: prolipoprotein diacylglyceryl transferase [Jatrophihabitans sp.]|uniref:prolipoprotein diacylglyceryl transferase n=1 Tax=Jatrophihabitans sp. TaxID=1932789 RepID=UPI003F7F72B7